MADVKQPKSIPCRFEVAWVGECKKPSTNGLCGYHENQKCASCGVQAIHSCDYTNGPMACGAFLCATCTHSLDGDGHVTQDVYGTQREVRCKEKEETALSRTSSVRRIHPETGLPLNLFELLKGDWKSEGYSLERCHYLCLKHGLMGFFPAIVKSEDRMIISTDQILLLELWKLLSPRRSEMDSIIAYVNEGKGIIYEEAKEQERQERIKPIKMLTRSEFTSLLDKEQEPFGWAPGLIGADMNVEEFRETVEAAGRKCA